MRWVLVVALLLASGCNQLLGLDETLPADALVADRDGDGVADEVDNCPDLGNADQLDSDGDGQGDACDGCAACRPCPVGPDHDEDGDQIPDGCDNCPTVASADVTNTDNDDLGDVCDTSPAMQHRVFFDGFGSLAASWALVGAWGVSGDAAEALEGPHPLNYRLTHLGALIDGATPWSLEIAFDVPVSPAERDSIGANLVDDQSNPKWGCTVLWQDGTWSVTNGLPQSITLASGRTTMKLSSLGASSTDNLCTVLGNPEKVNGPLPVPYPLSFELFSGRPARFAYAEVIQ